MAGEVLPAVAQAGKTMEKVGNGAEAEALPEKVEDLKLYSEDKLGKFWVWPEDARPELSITFDFDLPIVDLSPVLKFRELQRELEQSNGRSNEEALKTSLAAKMEVEKQIRAACEEYGFFQIINHGFPMSLVERLKRAYIQLFELPLEVKKRVAFPWSSRLIGYNALDRESTLTSTKVCHVWHEGLIIEGREVMYTGAAAELASTLWSEDQHTAEQWRSTVEEYKEQASSVSRLLLDLMAGSLGLPEGSVQEFLGYDNELQLRALLLVNHYPVCPQPELAWGLRPHTDPAVMTLLHQDDVGGLQIAFKDGTLHGVRPIPGAFIINAGDFCQAWTNGQFISAKHQVVVSKKSPRYSIAYFVHADHEKVVIPRPELVDNEHPIKYRPFTWNEYIREIYVGGLSGTRVTDHLLERTFSAETQA